MTGWLLAAIRNWAPREGARIGPIPERAAFTVVMVVALALLVGAAILLLR